MINEPIITEERHYHRHAHKRISWTAIFIGALVALGLGFLLNLFGLAIGLSAFTLNDTGANVIAIGGLLGILIGVIVSMLAAGYTAGYLGRLYCPKRNLGIVYGFSTWTLALILSALITAPLSQHVSTFTKNNVTSPSVSVTTDNSKNANNNLTSASVESTSTPTAQNPNQKTININAPTETLAWGAFSIFLLFFLSAFFCCLGACWGMNCHRDD